MYIYSYDSSYIISHTFLNQSETKHLCIKRKPPEFQRIGAFLTKITLPSERVSCINNNLKKTVPLSYRKIINPHINYVKSLKQKHI